MIRGLLTSPLDSIDDRDYLILYAGANEVGETVLRLPRDVTVITTEARTLSYSFMEEGLIINYGVHGSQYVDIVGDGVKLTVIVLEKAVAYSWHAPVIAGVGDFGSYFSIGTNET